VVQQVGNVAHTILVGDARKRVQSLMMCGWIYGRADARLQELGAFTMEGSELEAAVPQAVAAVRARHGMTGG
jgi:carbonic anhydrase